MLSSVLFSCVRLR